MLIPTYYKAVPWMYRELQIDLSTAKVVFNSSVTMKKVTEGRIWFSQPVLNHIEWDYPEQRSKLLALLSYWLIFSDLPVRQHLLKVSVDYASGNPTLCDWLFSERVRFRGQPSLTLAQVLLEMLEYYMRFEFGDGDSYV